MKTRIALAIAVAFALAFTLAMVARADDAKVEGKWESKFTTPQGERTTTFTFKQEGNKLTGTVSGGMGGEAPLTGTVKGNEVKFSLTRQMPNGQEFKTEYTATVEGDTMKGKAEGPRGSRDWSATKVK